MNKKIIFVDLGGVYFTSSFDPVTKKYSKIFGVTQRKMLGAMRGKNWKMLAEDKCSDAKYWATVVKKTGLSEKQALILRHECYNYPTRIAGMKLIIKRIGKKYKVMILSSHARQWSKVMQRKHNFENEFHSKHYSFDYGIDKPDARLFLKAAAKMKATPEECIVIDDNKPFIKAVKKTGATAILFRNPEQLKAKLIKLGVLE